MSRYQSSNTTDRGTWPVVLLLSLVVLIPSATVLWLTNAAVRNERSAVRERLTQAYEARLQQAESRIAESFHEIDASIELLAAKHSGPKLFDACIADGVADSVLVVGADGSIVYPMASQRIEIASLNAPALAIANQLEFQELAFGDAAEAFAAIASEESDPNAEARAWMAHARCLVKAGQVDQAVDVMTDKLSERKLRLARDQNGRRVWIDAQLRAAQLMLSLKVEPSRLTLQQKLLREALEDYSEAMPSAQRQFAMREFRELFANAAAFATFEAERLAMEQLVLRSQSSTVAKPPQPPSDIVQVRFSQGSKVVLLSNTDRIVQQLSDVLEPWSTKDERLVVLPVANVDDSPAHVAITKLSHLPAWRLAIEVSDLSLFNKASSSQSALYSIAALLTIAAVAVCVATIGWFVRRQLRLAQLKNDLAAVVTHELRTPLASIRVLVDTLLDNDSTDPIQTKDYLQLIAKENERLSRLIDNFLTFSRLERHQQQFDFQEHDPVELADRAITAINGKLQAPSCAFTLETEDDLPLICVDSDAIVTVVLNLLDNAVKFSGDSQQIALRVTRLEQDVQIEIEDQGIGMSQSDAKNAFDRFFQADTRLSRSHGGCGLGLSLVRSIVDAHGGHVSVTSVLGVGSTFTVRLPQVSNTTSP